MDSRTDDYNSLYPEPPHGVFASPSINTNQHMSPNRFFPGATPQAFLHPATTTFDDGSAIVYSDLPITSMFGDQMSPAMFYDDSEMRTSSLSTASGPSAPSSAVGSPRSHHDIPTSVPEWPAPQVLNVSPSIVSQGDFFGPGEYSYTHSMDEYTHTHFDFPQPGKSFIGKYFFLVILHLGELGKSTRPCIKRLLLYPLFWRTPVAIQTATVTSSAPEKKFGLVRLCVGCGV